MDVLLINPIWTYEKRHAYSGVGNVLPPLGLAYIAAVIENKCHNVKIFDGQVSSDKEFENIITSFKPKIVGISSMTSFAVAAYKTADKVRRMLPDSLIVMGGPHPTILVEEALKKGVDVVVRGEGEYIFADLVENYPAYDEVKGISFIKNGKITHNPDRGFIKNLDELPFPARHLIKMDRYKPTPGNYKRSPVTSMISSRGCPYKCTFCSKAIFGGVVRMRSAENIIKEIEHLIEKYNIKEVLFHDDTLTLNSERMIQICDLIIKKNLDITWNCFARVNNVTKPLLEKMKAAGCCYVGYGVETGDAKILENIKKGVTLDQVRNAVKLTKEVGLEVRVFMMFGAPGETLGSIQRSMKFVKEIKPDITNFNILTPYPGTEIYNWAKENGYLVSEDWSLYEQSVPLINLPTISNEEIRKWYVKSFKSFYLNPAFVFRSLLKIRNIEDIKRYLKAGKGVLGLK
ncbi:MAG: radical SAM protein [Nanoarchaeota archaeon]|nr:radical SAM protein [Nanoarchaeota archaeon]